MLLYIGLVHIRPLQQIGWFFNCHRSVVLSQHNWWNWNLLNVPCKYYVMYIICTLSPYFIEQLACCQLVLMPVLQPHVWGICSTRERHVCFVDSHSACSFTDSDGRLYDLSSLSLSDSNYELTSSDGSMRFALSVCSSLVHTRGLSFSLLSGFIIFSLFALFYTPPSL